MLDLIPPLPTPFVRTSPLENEARIITAINRVVDQDFVPYLLEAWRCYTVQANNSAILWVWCAISCYVRAVIRHAGEEIFRFRMGKNVEALERVNDEQLLETCKSMGILDLTDPTRFGWLTDFRSRRNALAHGEWRETVTPSMVVDILEAAVHHLLCHSVREHTLAANAATIFDLACGFEMPLEPDRIETLLDNLVDPENLLLICHRLIGVYVSEEAANPHNVLLVWRAVYKCLARIERDTVAERSLKDTALALGLKAVKEYGAWVIAPFSEDDSRRMKPGVSYGRLQAMLDIDVWKDKDILVEDREGYYEVFIILFEQEAEAARSQTGDSSIQHRYLRDIKQHAPDKYRGRIEELYASL